MSENHSPRWRVEVGGGMAEQWPGWRIVSPRGVEVLRAPTLKSGVEVATALASVDELLARVARLERHNFGAHPALAAPARRAYWFGPAASLPSPRRGFDADVISVDEANSLDRACCGSPLSRPHADGCPLAGVVDDVIPIDEARRRVGLPPSEGGR